MKQKNPNRQYANWKLIQRVMDYSKALSPYKGALIAIAYHADEKGVSREATNRQLMLHCGMKKDLFYKAIRNLRDLGELHIWPSELQGVTLYRILVKQPEDELPIWKRVQPRKNPLTVARIRRIAGFPDDVSDEAVLQYAHLYTIPDEPRDRNEPDPLAGIDDRIKPVAEEQPDEELKDQPDDQESNDDEDNLRMEA